MEVTNQPPSFQLPLFQEQCRTLAWMRQREEEHLEYLSRELLGRQCMKTDIGIELRVDRHWTRVQGGILADSVGYGKTACMIGLIQVGLQKPIGSCMPAEELAEVRKRFILSNATLIVTPPNLFEQWLGEFKKFLQPEAFETSRIIEIPHIHRLNKLSVEDFANADVVIVPYRFFFSGVYDRYLDETIGRTTGQMGGESKTKWGNSQLHARRYAVLREFVTTLLADCAAKVEANPEAAKETAAGQKMPAEVLSRMAPTLEAFYWKRVVFDEFHEVLSIREGRPFHALRQCFARFHWGLTATPPLSSPRDVADMASLLHISIPPSSQREAQHFLDEWVRSSSWDTSSIPLDNRIIEVRHTREERLLYLHQRNTGISRGGRMSFADEERLLQLCSHYSPSDDIADDGGGATTAVVKRREKLTSDLAAVQASLAAARVELPSLQRRAQATADLRSLFVLLGLPSGNESKGAALAVCDANRISGDWNAEEMERFIAQVHRHLPAPPRAASTATGSSVTPTTPSTAKATAASPARGSDSVPLGMEPEQPQVVQEVPEAVKSMLQDLAKQIAPLKAKGHKPRFNPRGPAIQSHCHALELQIKKEEEQSAQLERSVRFFESTFQCMEKDDELECPVCMDDCKPKDRAITSCGHVFHSACIEAVIHAQGSCPSCRTPLRVKDTNMLQQVLDDCRQDSTGEDEGKEAPQHGSKMAKIVETLHQLRNDEPGAKVIMFCQWEKILKHIAQVLVDLGEPAPLVLKGTMVQRQLTIRNFVHSADPGHSVLLLSLERSPTGMNLVSCRHLFLVHPMHAQTKERAVAFELQAIGRLRRQGQQRKVIVHRFVTKGTVEQEVSMRHQTHLEGVDEQQRKARQADEKAAKKKKAEKACGSSCTEGAAEDPNTTSEVQQAVQMGL